MLSEQSSLHTQTQTQTPSQPVQPALSAEDAAALARFNRARFGFAAGVGAAAFMLVVLALLRIISGTPSLAEVFADWVLHLLPGATFSYVIDNLQHAAKPLLYLGIGIGTLVIGGLLGRWYATVPGWRTAALLGLAGWIVFGVLIYGASGDGVFGSRLASGVVWNALSLLFVFAVFAGSLYLLFDYLQARSVGSGVLAAPAPEADQARRTLLASGFGALLLAALGGLTIRLLPQAGGGATDSQAAASLTTALAADSSSVAVASANAAPFNAPGISPEITPTGDFYQVSKNFIDPHVDAAGWSLKIEGLVTSPFQLNYQSLTQLPAVEGSYTLMCISNEVGGDLWGNAIWRGVPIKSLLDQAGMQPGVSKAVFTAADNYQDSVDVANVLNPEAMIVWQMNGQPLQPEHGFPARLLIPGIYGMKNVKWVTSIKLVSGEFEGYWQEQGWDNAAPYQTAARIDTPSGRSTVIAGTVPIAGVAFAGNRGIQKVEISTDSGQTWQPAQVKPALGDNAWQLWLAQVPLTSGTKLIKVRATDGLGHLQTPTDAEPFPSGSTGYHTVRVAVTG